jgi:hypothetical protein
MATKKATHRQGLHRLVVRTSRRGRDNPGSTPGVVNLLTPSVFCSWRSVSSEPKYYHKCVMQTKRSITEVEERVQSGAESSSRCQPDRYPRGYGATAARLTPDQKVGSSNLSGLKFVVFVLRHVGMTTLVSLTVRIADDENST